ncbi:hypothetical protein ON010_g16541 [Phytophthora cinnamomi]|nr:hypothetical protein ON010_g16541 [Phytophthora cinnamomi]
MPSSRDGRLRTLSPESSVAAAARELHVPLSFPSPTRSTLPVTLVAAFFDTCRRALAEAVLELALHVLQVAHAAGARGAATQGLLAPVVLAHLGSGVATRRAGALLDVVRAAPTPSADGVGLVVAHTEALRTFRLHRHKQKQPSGGGDESGAMMRCAAPSGRGHRGRAGRTILDSGLGL